MVVQRVVVVVILIPLAVPYQAIGQSLAPPQTLTPPLSSSRSFDTLVSSAPPSQLTQTQPDDVDGDGGPYRYKSRLFWTGMTLLSAGGLTGFAWFDQKYPFDGSPTASPRKQAATFRTAGTLLTSGLVCLIVYEIRRDRKLRRRASKVQPTAPSPPAASPEVAGRSTP